MSDTQEENIYDDVEAISRSADMGDFNFWEINNYKKTVKRMEDGAKLCDDIMKLMSERAEIEASYCSKMKAWSKKWEESHKRGMEYGALKTAMYGIMVEGEQLADVHYELKEKLMNNVYQNVNQWKKDNYHKSLMNYKEVKNAEEGFSKAQKPWARRLDEVHKCKKGYHSSCRSRDTAKTQQEEGKLKGSNDEQLKKLQDKVEKYSEEVGSFKAKYQDALRDLTGYIAKYQEDMKYQFNKCQDFEETRKTFFESLLIDYHKAINRDQEYISRMSVIYQHLLGTLKKTDTKHDLDFFAEIYGVHSELKTPEYEEYDPNTTGSSGWTNTTSPSSKRKNNDSKGDSLKPSRSGVCTTL